MHKYCKAYVLKDLRQFSGWTEDQNKAEEPLTDETVVYLWDDFSVVLSPVVDAQPLFVSDTSAWKGFCKETLQFSIPEDLQYAYQNG